MRWSARCRLVPARFSPTAKTRISLQQQDGCAAIGNIARCLGGKHRAGNHSQDIDMIAGLQKAADDLVLRDLDGEGALAFVSRAAMPSDAASRRSLASSRSPGAKLRAVTRPIIVADR